MSGHQMQFLFQPVQIGYLETDLDINWLCNVIDLMHWRHKGSHLHNNDASLVSRSAHVLCWQCALALSLSVRGPGRASPAVWLAGFAPAWRWRTWQCFVWPPTQLGALLWRHMHMVYWFNKNEQKQWQIQVGAPPPPPPFDHGHVAYLYYAQ